MRMQDCSISPSEKTTSYLTEPLEISGLGITLSNSEDWNLLDSCYCMPASFYTSWITLMKPSISVNPGTAFEPSYKGVPSQLLDGYFTNLIGPRMHVNGQQTIPSGETWVLHDISTVKHSYAKKPVQDLVSSYSRASSYVRDNTISYFRAESPQLQSKSIPRSNLYISD